MVRVNYNIEYGTIKVKSAADEKKLLPVKIHQMNGLAAFIYHYKDDDGQKMAQLWMFLGDMQHVNNIMKNSDDHTLLGTSVVSCKLNVYYKEARQLIEPMCKSGYKVECYYKEPKKNKK